MFELEVARRHIVANKRVTGFTLLTVAIAVGVIVMTLGLTQGTRMQIVENTVEKNPHILIKPKEKEDYIYLYRTLSRTLADYPEVAAISSRLLGQGAARYRNKVQGIEFYGIEPEAEDRLMKVRESTIMGNFFDLKHKMNAVFLGRTLADNLDVEPGDDIYISLRNRSLKVRVEGLIQKGTVKDSVLVFMPLKTAQNLAGQGDVVSEIGLRIYDFNKAPAFAGMIESETSYRAESWQDFNREISRFLGTQSRINVIFYGLIFLISGFVVANTAIMTVRRRTKEIGMLMAMGAMRTSILKIFMLESIMLSLPAGILGLILGILFGKGIESYPLNVEQTSTGVTKIMLDLRPEFMLYAFFFALLLNLLAGIYPAIMASKLDPVEAIGSE